MNIYPTYLIQFRYERGVKSNLLSLQSRHLEVFQIAAKQHSLAKIYGFQISTPYPFCIRPKHDR